MKTRQPQLNEQLKAFLGDMQQLAVKHKIPKGAFILEAHGQVAFYPFGRTPEDIISIIHTCKNEIPEKAEQALDAFKFVTDEVAQDSQATRH